MSRPAAALNTDSEHQKAPNAKGGGQNNGATSGSAGGGGKKQQPKKPKGQKVMGDGGGDPHLLLKKANSNKFTVRPTHTTLASLLYDSGQSYAQFYEF